MTDDSSWSEYYSGDYEDYKGVFIKNRTVTLSPFVMGQYEVTQELYEAVMRSNPSKFKDNQAVGETQKLRPVEQVTWYQAVAFCNKLTEILDIKDAGGNIDYVYYKENTFQTVYDATDAANETTPYMKPIGDSKGYRLPTEAEWEFAARGGNAAAEAWKYAFAGVQTTNTNPSNFESATTDGNLANYGWYKDNSESKTHEVGRKTANSLGLFDMSGNVWEWCWDWYATVGTETVTNPTGSASGSIRVSRGSSWRDNAYDCAVSYRRTFNPNSADAYYLGFRACRSVDVAVLESISVHSSKTYYNIGENVSESDITVTAHFSNGTLQNVTGYTISPATFTAEGTSSVTISYTFGGITKTAEYDVTVINVVNGYAPNGNLIINRTECEKTGEQVIVPAGTTATVAMNDDSSWSMYYSGSGEKYKGVFIKNRTVKLYPYAMGKYEVTQELYEAVMGSNPSNFKDNQAAGETQKLRPVEKVSWYQAVAFCNKLTEILDIKDAGGNIDYVYYKENTFQTPYDATAATNKETPYMKPIGMSKGYRLPTEAEWEFAARGGDSQAEAWKYAFAGVQTTHADPSNFASATTDGNLANYGWYKDNSESKTHEVGRKTANSLGLFDMSGNVWEWCWDWYATVGTETVTNPTGSASGSIRVHRGGSWYNYAYSCAVSNRRFTTPDNATIYLGFRVCRSF